MPKVLIHEYRCSTRFHSVFVKIRMTVYITDMALISV